jgi:hypothetical protein
MYMVSRRSSENVSDYLQHSDAATQPRKNSAAQELSHPESEAVCNVKGGVRGGGCTGLAERLHRSSATAG